MAQYTFNHFIVMNSAKAKAEHFLCNEKQFHLGDLITEQSHPKTREFSQTVQRNPSAGIQQLLQVDQDMPPVAAKVFGTAEFRSFTDVLRQTVQSGRRICFSSCGASGRAAVILESMWRKYWMNQAEKHPHEKAHFMGIGDQVTSIITGGERALIRSVEHFEDYQSFGRRQVKDAGLSKGDTLVALLEGGEISSVIGTMKESLEQGVRVYMLYHNPRELLEKRFKRSREMLDHPQIGKIEIVSGPMALTGSTRMQATTLSMLIAGAALELCVLADEKKNEELPVLIKNYAGMFSQLISEFSNPAVVDALAKMTCWETEIYSSQGRVTYFADRFLSDVLADTTERTPTFMIPPFRKKDDSCGPVSWAFAKTLQYKSLHAWDSMLGRKPHGLKWLSQDYIDMGAESDVAGHVPMLDQEEIYSYLIGNEDDESRYDCQDSGQVWVGVEEEMNSVAQSCFERNKSRFKKAILFSLGKTELSSEGVLSIHVPLNLPSTPFLLFHHLAVKIAFNTVSTATMGIMGRIQGNWMVQVDATNKKLTDRAVRIISHLADISYEKACYELFATMEIPDVNRLEFKESYVMQTLRRLNRLPK